MRAESPRYVPVSTAYRSPSASIRAVARSNGMLKVTEPMRAASQTAIGGRIRERALSI
jgi:hypothetical protein